VSEEHDHVQDDLAGYALDSLETPERARVEAHLASCPACARRLHEYRAVAGLLPAALPPVAPPAEAWAAIWTAARAARRPEPRVPRARWVSAARWSAVGALVASLLIWNVGLHRELARRAPGPAPGPEVEALSRRPGRIVILAGAGAPRASARIFLAVDGGGHLAISGLPPLARDRTYQLWFVRSAAPPMAGTTFTVDSSGRAWAKVAVPPSLDDVREITVTDEPAPGSATPTGRPLLVAPGPG
jgi:anti-sigma-K factor RskA